MAALEFVRNVALRDFKDFVRYSPKVGGRYLQDYISDWLAIGNAAYATAEDFETYLQAVALIIAEWSEDPEILYYKGQDDTTVKRTIEGVFEFDTREEKGWTCIDRQFFMSAVVDQRYPQRVDPRADH